jgi:hypothetical protein
LSAFRLFLMTFQIPGQALINDRVMELFRTKFFNHNPRSLFSCTDEVYFLSFSKSLGILRSDLKVIMLCTRYVKESFGVCHWVVLPARGVDAFDHPAFGIIWEP